MRNIPTYKNLSELLDVLKQIKSECYFDEVERQCEFYPIQPIRIGNKIGFVDWSNGNLKCLPIFDDYDREFSSIFDCICVRKGNKWGVLNSGFSYELPVEYPYAVANQICKILKCQDLCNNSIRKYESHIKFN